MADTSEIKSRQFIGEIMIGGSVLSSNRDSMKRIVLQLPNASASVNVESAAAHSSRPGGGGGVMD